MAAFSYSSHQDIFDVDVADFPDGSNLPPLLPPPQQHQQQHPQAGGTFVASSGFPAIFYHPSDCHSVIRAEMTAANSTATATPASSSSLENARIASPFPFAQRAESPLERKRKDDQKCNTISSQLKITKQKKCSGDTEKGREKRALEEPHTEYIHVKARRGQATDSHSLAERVRREKIRDRMKMLQGLIPGCDKVIGKALLLDEIINYVQSLQNQVEFLSMKLTSLNPRLYEFGLNSEGFLISPEKLEEMSLELPYIQQKYPHPAIAFTDTADSCPIQDSPPAFQLHGEDRAAFPQDNGDSSAVQFDYNRETLLNQVDFSSVPSSFR